jgi:site-specific recombinase XerD
VAELCTLYLADAEAGRLLTRRGASKRASTLLTDRSRIDGHIRPLLVTMKVPAVTRQDVEGFMRDVTEGRTRQRVKLGKPRAVSIVRGGKGAAARTVGLLGALFTYAVRKGMRPLNPVTGTVRYADGRRDRRLTDADYAALGKGLAAAAVIQPGSNDKPGKALVWPAAIAVTRFLALTGWRSGEALGLTWGMVDLTRRTATLPMSKTGHSIRPLATAACDVLRGLDRGDADALVFPASRGDGPMSGFPSLFARIGKAGGLATDVTPHALRHSFASLGNDLGLTEATIGVLVGHKGGCVTRGSIHTGDAVFPAADLIAGATLLKMGDEVLASVVSDPGNRAVRSAPRQGASNFP